MTDSGEIVESYTALWNRLNGLQQRLRSERLGLDAADVIAARDCVEVLRDLLVEVSGHRFDTQHLHDKGVYPKPRLADVRLYERAGLPPLDLSDFGRDGDSATQEAQ